MKDEQFVLLLRETDHANIYFRKIGPYKGQGKSCFITTKIEDARSFPTRQKADEFRPKVAELSTVEEEDIQIVSASQ